MEINNKWKLIKRLLLPGLALISVAGCTKNFERDNTNPNNATQQQQLS